jgi:hypothetical protein
LFSGSSSFQHSSASGLQVTICMGSMINELNTKCGLELSLSHQRQAGESGVGRRKPQFQVGG